MNKLQLIEIKQQTIGDDKINAVSARELHTNLEIQKQFTDWVNQFLDDFIQDTDFVEVHSKVNINNVKMTEYLFSLDMAKQIAMLTRTAKGKEIRLYFIECEKQLTKHQLSLPKTYKEALLALVEAEEVKEQLQLELKETNQELDHKQNVIVGLVDNIDLIQKRTILNQVMRKGSNYQERWNSLYTMFQTKYHVNLPYQSTKHKCSKIDYIDKVMNKIDSLYEMAAKLFETDLIKVKDQLFPELK